MEAEYGGTEVMGEFIYLGMCITKYRGELEGHKEEDRTGQQSI